MANAKTRLKKYPKMPKTKTVESLEAYKRRCQEVDKHNAQVAADKKKVVTLKKQISDLKSKRRK